MGLFKKLFGGKSESEKAQEEAKQRAQELLQSERQKVLDRIITNQEKHQQVVPDSIDQENLVKIDVTDEESWRDISFCLEEDDGTDFRHLLHNAIFKSIPFFYFPKDKWEKASAEWEIRKQTEHLRKATFDLIHKGSELEKSGDIENAISMYEESIKIGYPEIYQYERLVLLYHKIKDTENEKRILTKALELFPDNTRFIKKLAVLNGTFEEKTITSAPKDVSITKVWGDLLEERILQVPEFDFYFEQETNPQKYEYDFGETRRKLSPIFEIRDHFKAIVKEAETAEEMGEQEQAARLYEQMVAEKYYMPSPYDRLIKIYSKAKLHDEEIRILKVGIAHFKQLREKRKAYVLHLAQKYDAVDFAKERIISGKKITYYDGAFELYNPFPIVERWEARLQKIQSNK